MTGLSDKDKSLASLAVFCSLYDTHRNLRDVLIDFIKMSIMEHGDLILRPLEVQGYLRKDYGFDNIPIAVIERAMDKAPFLNKSKTERRSYNVNSFKLSNDTQSYLNDVNVSKQEINIIIKSLRNHLINKNFPNVDRISDAHLQRALSMFLIESNHSSSLSTLIQQFIILHTEYKPILQKISNGALIFMGLSYSTKGTEYTILKEPLTIYIDTEILFYGAGYDGPTFTILFKEFIETVYKVNSLNYERTGKKLIHLKYFPQIKKEVDDYFSMAEKIITGKAQLDPSRTAMSYIVRNAKTPSDLVRMKARFWEEMCNNDIQEEKNNNYYDSSNIKYNIESEEFINKLRVRGYTKGEDAKDNLAFLNFVNIRRKNRDQRKFDSIGFLFITQTVQAFRLSTIIQKETHPENFPLAVSLSQITARLWLGLNQGFNPSSTLLSMDVIVKAQIGMSSKITACIEKKYNELQKEHSHSSPEIIASELAAIKVYLPYNPEELTPEADIVHNINNLEKFLDDKILEVQQKDEIIRTKEASILEIQKQHSEDLKKKEKENKSLRQILIDKVKEEHNKDLQNRKKKRKDFINAHNKNSFLKSLLALIFILGCVTVSVILFIKDNLLGGWTILGIGLFGIILDLIKKIYDNTEVLIPIIIPISKRFRKRRMRLQLKKFQESNPPLSLKIRIGVTLKNLE